MDVRLTSIRLPSELHTRIKVMAAKKGKSMKAVVIEAMMEKLNKEE